MEKYGEVALREMEQNGLKRMRLLNEEFLSKSEGSEEVRDFLDKASSDNGLMLIYLKGRKYRPEHAWKTLKRKGEVRFDQYPEVFVHEVPRCLARFQKHGVFGLLKSRDKLGRRIISCNGYKFNPDEYSMLDVTQVAVYITERLLKDEDAMNNGVTFIQNCQGMRMNHARQYTLHAMLRILNIFWYACPLMFKGIYYVNVPYYLTFIYGIIKPFFSKKLKERVIVTTTHKQCEAIFANVSRHNLPKFLGGKIEDNEAFEEVL